MKSLQDRVRHVDYARYHGGARSLDSIDTIITHATEGDSFASSMGWLNRLYEEDGKTLLAPGKHASYNYGLERDGTIVRMLPITTIAYHAGDSAWPSPSHYPPGNGGASVNHRSIGIAFALEDGEKPTDIQMESGIWLHRYHMDTLKIPPSLVRGHFEVSPGRKTDPGLCFDMGVFRDLLAEAA